MQETLRTVKYSMSDDAKFEKIAQKLGRSKRLVLSQMIDYFYRSKKDPVDLNDELLKNTILKGQRDYIGFIRTQETELLIPIKRDTTMVVDILKRILHAFGSHIIKHNEEIVARQTSQEKRLAEISIYIRNLERSIDTKRVLKERFSVILNGYIKERERFTLMTPAKDKEELIENARRQLEIL